MKQRLNKQMVKLGLADSRRSADTQIANGEVKVNNALATLGMQVDENDKIENGIKQHKHNNDITILLNKPVGLVCSHVAQGSSKTIFSILPNSFKTLRFAGRLDKDSEGLLILSSDGDLIQKLTHPSQKKMKKYQVIVKPEISKDDRDKLTAGVKLEDGLSKFKKLKVAKECICVSMFEGRNRQIRRSFEYLGYKVVKLKRIEQGELELGTLKAGEYRFLSQEEVAQL